MKRKWIVIGIAIAAFAVLSITGLVWAGTAYAQTQAPPDSSYHYGGMMGGYDGFGMMGGWDDNDYGPMHQDMVDALAEGVGLTPEEVQSRINAGETSWEIAESQGLSVEEIEQVMFAAHEQALAEAVEDGLLTQEQADWMDGHMESMWTGEGAGYGGCHGGWDTADDTRFGPMMGWDG